jgi:predicted dehydrogenase
MIGKVVAVQGTYSRNDPQGDWNWPIDPGAGPNGKGEDHIDWVQWLGAAAARSFDADRFFRFRKYWDYSGGIATDLHYHIVAPFHVALPNDHPTRVAGMGGAWIYKDGREVPDTFLTAADYPSNYSMTIQSSQVNENGPVLLLRGTEATIHLGDEWEGPQGRRRDYAQIALRRIIQKEIRQGGSAHRRCRKRGGPQACRQLPRLRAIEAATELSRRPGLQGDDDDRPLRPVL